MRVALTPISLLLIAIAMLTGCASSPEPPASPAGQRSTEEAAFTTGRAGSGRLLESIDTRDGAIRVFATRSVVVPVSLTRTERIPTVLEARLEDGRPIRASLLWLAASATEQRWLPQLQWSFLAPDQAVAAQPGRWVLLLDLPIDAVGQSLFLEGRRHRVIWEPLPGLDARAEAQVGDTEEPWQSPLIAQALRSAQLRQSLNDLARDPFMGWRAELALGTLLEQHRQPLPAVDDRGFAVARDAVPPAQRARDVITSHQRARWVAALQAAWQIDTARGVAFRDALTRVVRTGRDVFYPFWGHASEADVLDRLASDLTNDELTTEVKLSRLDQWLDAQPPAVAWVLDDAGGTLSETGAVNGPTVALINLEAADSLAWVETGEGPAVNNAPGLSVTSVAVPDRAAAGDRLEVHCGTWNTLVAVASAPQPVRPPGAGLAPFLAPWTAPALLAQDPALDAGAVGQRLTSGLLFKRASDAGGQWVVLLEASGPTLQGDEIRLWIGPFATPGAIYTATPSAGARTVAGEPFAEARVGIAQSESAPSWRAEFVLPDSLVAEGMLRISAARLRDGQTVSSWPRRMVPWQTEPGRALLDLEAWASVLPPSR